MSALEESQKDAKREIRHWGQYFPPKMTAGSTPVIVSVEIYGSATCP